LKNYLLFYHIKRMQKHFIHLIADLLLTTVNLIAILVTFYTFLSDNRKNNAFIKNPLRNYME